MFFHPEVEGWIMMGRGGPVKVWRDSEFVSIKDKLSLCPGLK